MLLRLCKLEFSRISTSLTQINIFFFYSLLPFRSMTKGRSQAASTLVKGAGWSMAGMSKKFFISGPKRQPGSSRVARRDGVIGFTLSDIKKNCISIIITSNAGKKICQRIQNRCAIFNVNVRTVTVAAKQFLVLSYTWYVYRFYAIKICTYELSS